MKDSDDTCLCGLRRVLASWLCTELVRYRVNVENIGVTTGSLSVQDTIGVLIDVLKQLGREVVEMLME